MPGTLPQFLAASHTDHEPLIMDQSAQSESWGGREVIRLLDLVGAERQYLREIIASLPVAVAALNRRGEVLTSNRKFRELHAADLLESAELRTALERLVGPPSRWNASESLTVGPWNASLTVIRGWGDQAEAEVLLAVGALEEGRAAEPECAGDLPAAIWWMDADTLRLTSATGACAALLGISAGPVPPNGAGSFDWVHPSEREKVTGFYRQAIEAGTDFSCEYRRAGDGGQGRWNRDCVRILRTGDGPVRLNGITVDVTDRRGVDEQTLQAHRVAALVGLSRRLTHDLNNALMIIGGYGEELLSHFPERDSRRADVQALLAAAETIAGVAGELQGFTRTQAATRCEVPIEEALRASAARIRTELGADPVIRLSEPGLWGMAEPAQLEAVLLSAARALRNSTDPQMLLMAARKRLSEYTGRALAPVPGEYVEIVFCATLESVLEPQVFERFVTGRDPHGADLARAFSIVRDWGGWMSAAQSECRSEIRILLPAAAGAVAAGETPESEPIPLAIPGKAKTVLVVEDESGIRTLVRRILEREGYRVLEAANGDEADNAVRRSATAVDLLITDVRLSGERGPEVARRLTASVPQLRVVYMTGYADPAELPDGAAEKVLLRKPFTRSALVRKVQDALATVRQ